MGKVAQNQAHVDASSDCQGLPVEKRDLHKLQNVSELQPSSITGNLLNTCKVGDTGFEPVTSTL